MPHKIFAVRIFSLNDTHTHTLTPRNRPHCSAIRISPFISAHWSFTTRSSHPTTVVILCYFSGNLPTSEICAIDRRPEPYIWVGIWHFYIIIYVCNAYICVLYTRVYCVYYNNIIITICYVQRRLYLQSIENLSTVK